MTKAEIQREMEHRMSSRQRVLRAFRKHGELTTRDIKRFGTGVSSRIHELWEDGFKIVAVRERPDLYRYVFTDKDETELPEDWQDIKASATDGDTTSLAVVD